MTLDGERQPIDEARARDLRALLPTGVAVATTRHGPDLHGVTISAYCLVSLRPPLALICLERPGRAAELIVESGVFAVSILAWRQMLLADRFSGRAPLVDSQFSGVPYRVAATGSPIIEDCVAWLDCRVTATRPAGDHTLFLGEILDGAAESRGEPLVYFNRRYSRLTRRET